MTDDISRTGDDDIDRDDGMKGDSTHSNHDSAMSCYSSTNNSSNQYDFEDDDDDEEDARQQRSTDGSVDDNNNKTDVEYFASNENRWVQYSRILIVIMLIGSAATASFLTYYFLTKDESNEFQVQFSANAEEIIKKSDQKIQNAFRSMIFLSSLLSSSSSSNTNKNNTLPFYTMEDYEVFGYQTMVLSGASLVGYTPLIPESDRLEWEEYSVQQQGWIETGFEFGKDYYTNNSHISNNNYINNTIPPYIYRALSSDTSASSHAYSIVKEESGLGQYSPMWQMSPPPSQSSPTNLNLLSYKLFHRLIHYVNQTGNGVLSEVVDAAEMFNVEPSTFGKLERDTPKSIVVVPIYDSVVHTNLQNSTIVAHVVAVIPWTVFLYDTLKDDNNGILAVLTQSCGGSFTFSIDGSQANFLGPGDLHDPKYDNFAKFQNISMSGSFIPGHESNFTGTLNSTNDMNSTCSFEMAVYPTQQFEDVYETKRPLYVTLGVLVVFSFTSLMFLLYDGLVQYRQSKLMAMATKTSSIISNLFPAQVRDQLFGRLGHFDRRPTDDKSTDSRSTTSPRKEERRVKSSNKRKKNKVLTSSSYFPENFNPNGSNTDDEFDIDSKPIADLFPSATVLFGDIAGFTAWSSVREPSQVFILLETIYRAFDQIAKQRRVFKVETIGDCYVAVVGLPDPNKDHALVMARFARDILEKLNNLTHKLEVSLGPDTGDLMMRIGCHSGPVTAGVLRGERARFQLFGDTVNTAARMESTGMKNRIQISQETADLIIAGGKANWVELREDIVHAKGKGELQTYWLKHKSEKVSSGSNNSEVVSDFSTQDSDCDGNGRTKYDVEEVEAAQPTKSDKRQRMIDWNADILIKLLQRVLATRTVTGSQKPSSEADLTALEISMNKLGHCMQDVVEVIDLPKFDEAAYEFDLESAGISDKVAEQMRGFVTLIASMYRPNPFHNFEHASHVSMSTVKLLSRIVAPTSDIIESIDEEFENRDLHDYTYGITSDPLTQFAVVFSSLIHDVDHKGVPNFVLCKEEMNLASAYKDQSVAEQNSVDIAWGLLMEPNFKELRRAIYTNEDEMRRFRRLVVNSVIATDIFDKELSTLRKNRWEKAFSGDDSFSDTARCRKATIVIEHLIQASDVSHTMQHWHVYQKWNERLYREMYTAYMTGRTDKDPTEGWYQGELNFFDGYIIPLARKLKECGVFGVSSDEYLNYAEKNRAEWERKGKGIVAMMLQKYGGQTNSDAMQLANLDQALRNFSPEGKK